MVEASDPLPVFMKYCFSVPSSSVVVIFEVEAELQPPPPWDETEVLEGSRDSSCNTAESSFMVDVSADSLRMVDSRDGVTFQSSQ